jgi:hypothetical protein
VKLSDDINIDKKNDEEKLNLDLYVRDFDSQTAYITEEDLDSKTLKYIERQVRNSYEYRSYIKYLKEELDLTKCALLPSIDTKEIAVGLEFHHFPFTLYDITETIAKNIIDESEDKIASTIDIAERVISEHYQNNIGLVPLTKTIHEMAHNNSIYIPMKSINGNYKKFISDYSKYIDDALLDKVEATEMYNNSDSAQEFNKEKLRKRIINYDIRYNDNGDEI